MAGAFIHVTIDDAEARRLFDALRRRGRSMLPAMKRIGEIVTASVHENFVAGGRPTQWKPLASSTVWGMIGGEKGLTKKGELRKPASRKLQNHKLLIGSGVLKASIHPSPGATFVDVGSPMEYAAIHQFGGKTKPHVIKPYRKKALMFPGAAHPVKSVNHPGSNIPARPFLLVQEGDWPAITKTVADYLLEVRR